MRTVGLALALFAIAFKAMLPPGFMLDANTDRIAIVLCSGDEILVDGYGDRTDHDRGPANDADQQHCPYTLANAPVLADAAQSQAPVERTRRVAVIAPIGDVPVLYAAAGPPLPARGPPLQA